jgi:hypothetical protein
MGDWYAPNREQEVHPRWSRDHGGATIYQTRGLFIDGRCFRRKAFLKTAS